MAELPSPRSRIEATRATLVNALYLMTDDELLRVADMIGPFCMEKLLDATCPSANAVGRRLPEPEPGVQMIPKGRRRGKNQE